MTDVAQLPPPSAAPPPPPSGVTPASRRPSRRRRRPAAPPPTPELSARRRLLLGVSMLVVIPVGVFAIGTAINVVLAIGAQRSYADGDYLGSAGWARASVNLNPLDRYLPHYNLGTAYAASDLLDDAVPELEKAVEGAPSAEAACFPLSNLALVHERLGDRATDAQDWDVGVQEYQESMDTWAEVTSAECGDAAADKAEQGSDRDQEKLDEAQKNQDEQDQQNQGGQGTGQSGGGQGGSGDPSGGDQTGTGQGGQGGSGDPSGGGQTGTGEGGGTGDQSGGDQSGGAGGDGSGSSGGDGSGGDSDDSSTLGDKLGDLRERGEAAGRERDATGGGYGSSEKPW